MPAHAPRQDCDAVRRPTFAVKATGRISLRVAPTVHARFLTSAAAEGISLNRWIEKSASAAIPDQE